MKELIVLIAASVLVVSIIVAMAAVVALWKKKTNQRAETNYRIFFIMGVFLMPTGLSWMAVSILTELSITIGLPFFIIGVVYLGIGLGNRYRWDNKSVV